MIKSVVGNEQGFSNFVQVYRRMVTGAVKAQYFVLNERLAKHMICDCVSEPFDIKSRCYSG